VSALLGELERLLELVAGGGLWTTPALRYRGPRPCGASPTSRSPGTASPPPPASFPRRRGRLRAAPRPPPPRGFRSASSRTPPCSHRERRPRRARGRRRAVVQARRRHRSLFPEGRRHPLPVRRASSTTFGRSPRERPIVIQSLFLAFDGAPPDEAEIEAYCGRLRDLRAGGGRIDLVQVLYDLPSARGPSRSRPFLSPVSSPSRGGCGPSASRRRFSARERPNWTRRAGACRLAFHVEGNVGTPVPLSCSYKSGTAASSASRTVRPAPPAAPSATTASSGPRTCPPPTSGPSTWPCST